MKTILFVCTGNIFRSMVAEYALKAFLMADSDYAAASAGIEAFPQPMPSLIQEGLRKKGIDPAKHVQRKLTQEILDGAHLPVAMGLDHRDFIRRQFNRDVRLFNEICFLECAPVLDIHEAVPDWETNLVLARAHVLSVIDHIWGAMPMFLEKVRSTGKR
jgi:protein-tyrosine-phosphatase